MTESLELKIKPTLYNHFRVTHFWNAVNTFSFAEGQTFT